MRQGRILNHSKQGNSCWKNRATRVNSKYWEFYWNEQIARARLET